ncbi:variable surface protein [Plasmodium gonderi]|uniref:Variable surface protein n=1 Tax=Plasmodium gonderi TaxID=77519 RepID=A0A1Y1JQ50_PLAGO|nr:variable surface protein [Plasmodium gonderi]GAW84340.1 variable surface protein [Plasmodium gonderi]
MVCFQYIPQAFNKDNLPSNKYVNNLLGNDMIIDLLSKADSKNSSEVDEWIYKFNSDAMVYYNTIRKQCTEKHKNENCCRDINYSLDFITSVINLSSFTNASGKYMIDMLEEFWNNKLNTSDYVCERKKSSNYEEHLKNKWQKILVDKKSSIKNIIISNDGMSKTVSFHDFFLKYDSLKSLNININKNVNIIFFEENEFSPKLKGDLSTSTEPRSRRPSEINPTEQMSYIETYKIYNNNFPDKKLSIVVFILLGFITICIMLYNVIKNIYFTLLGTWLNNSIKCNKFIQKYICRNKTESSLSKKDYNKLYIAYKFLITIMKIAFEL